MKKLYYLLVTFLFLPTSASAGETTAIGQAQEALRNSAQNSLGSQDIASPAGVANSIVNSVVTFLGIISVVLIVYGGGLWLTAAGNDKKVEDAKKIITRTVVGVVIVGFAYAITQFILVEVITFG